MGLTVGSIHLASVRDELDPINIVPGPQLGSRTGFENQSKVITETDQKERGLLLVEMNSEKLLFYL